MGDLDACAQTVDAARQRVLSALSPATLRDTYTSLFHYPCRERYTAVVLLPESDTWLARAKHLSASLSIASAEAWLDASNAQRAAVVMTASMALIGIAAMARLRWHRS